MATTDPELSKQEAIKQKLDALELEILDQMRRVNALMDQWEAKQKEYMAALNTKSDIIKL